MPSTTAWQNALGPLQIKVLISLGLSCTVARSACGAAGRRGLVPSACVRTGLPRVPGPPVPPGEPPARGVLAGHQHGQHVGGPLHARGLSQREAGRGRDARAPALGRPAVTGDLSRCCCAVARRTHAGDAHPVAHGLWPHQRNAHRRAAVRPHLCRCASDMRMLQCRRAGVDLQLRAPVTHLCAALRWRSCCACRARREREGGPAGAAHTNGGLQQGRRGPGHGRQWVERPLGQAGALQHLHAQAGAPVITPLACSATALPDPACQRECGRLLCAGLQQHCLL